MCLQSQVQLLLILKHDLILNVHDTMNTLWKNYILVTSYTFFFKNIKLLYSTWPEVEPVLESFGWFLAGSSNNYKTSKKNAMMVCLECDVLAKIIDIHRQIKMIDKVQRADNTSLVWCLLIMNHILLLNYSFNVFLTDREIKVASVVDAKKFPLLCLCSFKDK